MPGRPTEAEAPTTRSGLRGDVEALFRAFDRAAEREGIVERDVVFGRFRIRLRAAGTALLEELWPAISHLEVGPDPGAHGGEDPSPDLTIAIWDSASTGVAPPGIPGILESGDNPRATRVVRGDDLLIAYRASERELVALDQGLDAAVLWLPDHADISINVRAAPFLPLLHWWMRTRGTHPVHAGAVGSPDGGVLLVGRGGSGKSTTAMACMLAGMTYAADDYVMLHSSPELYASSLYCSAKLDPEQAKRFPELARALRRAPTPGEKALIYMQLLRPDRVVRGFPVRAVLVPRVTEGPATAVRQVSPAMALAALAPSTLLGLPGSDGSAFPVMADLVRRVPCFQLELGSDLPGIAPAVRRALEAAS